MAKKKSSFYHVRKKICNAAVAADVLGVTVDDVERFDNEGAPVMAERLLLLWDSKSVGLQEWNGFYFSRGVLRYKSHRWTAKGLLDHHRLIDELGKAERELSIIKKRSLSTIVVDKAVNYIGSALRRYGF